jgi:hypothetical protein
MSILAQTQGSVPSLSAHLFATPSLPIRNPGTRRESAIFGAGIFSFFFIKPDESLAAQHRIASHWKHCLFSFVIIPLHITSPKYFLEKDCFRWRRKGKEGVLTCFIIQTHFLRYHGHLGKASSSHIYTTYQHICVLLLICCTTWRFLETSLTSHALLLECITRLRPDCLPAVSMLPIRVLPYSKSNSC